MFDAIRGIRDPEYPQSTLEDLSVVEEGRSISIEKLDGAPIQICVSFRPTIDTCTMTPIIGLCLLSQLMQTFSKEP